MNKKGLILIALLVLASFASLYAQDMAEDKMISVDMGAGISMAFPETDNALEGFFAFLFGLRGVYYADARYLITDKLSVGAELGFAAMSLEVNDEPAALFLDLPVRAIFRFGSGGTYVQAYAGVYVPVSPEFAALLDVGAKASLGGLYIEGSYLIGETSYPRVTLGYALNDMFGF